MKNREKAIFITWEKHRRTQSISRAFGIPLFEIDYEKSNPMVRYFLSLLKTLALLISNRPQVAICQNPSIVLALFAVFLKPFFSYILVIDAHNAGIFNDKNNYLVSFILKIIHRFTDLTIITNKGLSKTIAKNKGSSFILEDPLPQVPDELKIRMDLEGKQTICFICTYHSDEPFMEVFDAMESIPDSIVMYVTGKFPTYLKNKKLKNNIHLTGFLSEKDYWSLLSSVDIIMDLTTREGCLVCGAYEAIALQKPLILSDTIAIRDYFHSGSVYIKPDVQSIIEGINKAISDIDNLKKQAIEMNSNLPADWTNKFLKFKEHLNQLSKAKTGDEVF